MGRRRLKRGVFTDAGGWLAALLVVVVGLPVAAGIGLVAIFLAADHFIEEERALYHVLATMTDKNGLVVELAELEERLAGSFYYAVYVYDEIDPDRQYSESGWFPVIRIHITGDAPQLSYDGKCYVFEARYDVIYSYEKNWREWSGPRRLCFELRQMSDGNVKPAG